MGVQTSAQRFGAKECTNRPPLAAGSGEAGVVRGVHASLSIFTQHMSHRLLSILIETGPLV